WILVGVSVALWSLASGGSGLATAFGVMLLTRAFVGIGEAGYGPSAPTIISDLYPVARRGSVLAWFYLAIPVGSALGYAYGGFFDQAHWRWAFYLVVPPGLVLAIWSFFMPDPPRGNSADARPKIGDYLHLLRMSSYTLNTAAMAAMTFAIGGISFWMPRYLCDVRGLPASAKMKFGAITAVAGLIATLSGGWLGDRLRARFSGSYFLVSGF